MTGEEKSYLNNLKQVLERAKNYSALNVIEKLEKENAGQKAQIEEQVKLIETQYAENRILGNNNATLIHRLDEQQEQIKKMKCCGNCSYLRVDYDERYCEYNATSTKVCKNYSEWELAE